MQKAATLESSVSKALAYLLSYGPKKEGVEIDEQGFANLDKLLEKDIFKSKKITSAQVAEAIESEPRSNFEVQKKDSSFSIRLRQSLSRNEKDIASKTKKIEKSTDLPSCVFGTTKDIWETPKKEGLYRLPGRCFEFQASTKDFKDFQPDNKYDTFIEIDVEKAMADGIEFFLGESNKIYSKGIEGEFPPKYFLKASMVLKGKVISLSLEERERKKEGTAPVEESKEATRNKDEEPMPVTIDPNPKLNGTHFKYLCVLDFEAQCCEEKKLRVQEIIEFPVVVVDVEQKQIVETFHYYVKPVEFPKLFPFCTQLTGITQDKVDQGELLPDVLEKLHAFLQEKNILDSSFCFVTCGDWDLNICLRMEAKAKKLPVKGYLKRWINIKKVYPMPPDCQDARCGMVGLLRFSGLELMGRHHSGIDDSMNIARIVIYLLKKQFKFVSSMVAFVKY